MFQSSPGASKASLIVSASMVLVFLSLGCLFVFTDLKIDDYPRPYRNYIGYVLGGWAIFRGISVWMKFRSSQQQDDEE